MQRSRPGEKGKGKEVEKPLGCSAEDTSRARQPVARWWRTGEARSGVGVLNVSVRSLGFIF